MKMKYIARVTFTSIYCDVVDYVSHEELVCEETTHHQLKRLFIDKINSNIKPDDIGYDSFDIRVIKQEIYDGEI